MNVINCDNFVILFTLFLDIEERKIKRKFIYYFKFNIVITLLNSNVKLQNYFEDFTIQYLKFKSDSFLNYYF